MKVHKILDTTKNIFRVNIIYQLINYGIYSKLFKQSEYNLFRIKIKRSSLK